MVEGYQDWILIPSTDKEEIARLISSCATVHGKAVVRAKLAPGDAIYVPYGWTYKIASTDRDCEAKGRSVSFSEVGLVAEGVEEAAVSFGEQELHAIKKALSENDLYWHVWRRFTEVLRQRRRRVKK